jgi:hypothetical protein
MALRYNRIEVNQEQIVLKTYGAGVDGQPMVLSANQEAITANLKSYGRDNNGKSFVVNADVYRGSPDNQTIVRHLATGRIVVMAYGPDAYSGHVVVLTGVSHIGSGANTQIMSLTVRDPWPGFMSSITGGRKVYVNGTLPAPIQWVWLVDAALLDKTPPQAPPEDSPNRYISMSGRKVVFHPRSAKHDVDFQATYKNEGNRTVSLTIRVPVGMVRRRETQDDKDASFRATSELVWDMTLKPGESKTFKGNLQWAGGDNTQMPSIQIADPKSGLFIQNVKSNFAD